MNSFKKILFLISLAAINYNLNAWIAELRIENETEYPIDVHVETKTTFNDYNIEHNRILDLKPLESENLKKFTIKYSPKYSSYLSGKMSPLDIAKNIEEIVEEQKNIHVDNKLKIQIKENKGWTPKVGGYGLVPEISTNQLNVGTVSIDAEVTIEGFNQKTSLGHQDYKIDQNLRTFKDIVNLIIQDYKTKKLNSYYYTVTVYKSSGKLMRLKQEDLNKTLKEFGFIYPDTIDIYFHETKEMPLINLRASIVSSDYPKKPKTEQITIDKWDSLEKLIRVLSDAHQGFARLKKDNNYQIKFGDKTYKGPLNRSLGELKLSDNDVITFIYPFITIKCNLVEVEQVPSFRQPNKTIKDSIYIAIEGDKTFGELEQKIKKESKIFSKTFSELRSLDKLYYVEFNGKNRAEYEISSDETLYSLGIKDNSLIIFNYYVEQKSTSKTQGPQKSAQQLANSPYYILGLPDKADDAQILGLTEEQLKNKSEVKKAYYKLAVIWHPDKRTTNEIAIKRYSDPEVLKAIGPDPDGKKIKALSEEVFKLISNAYDRNN